MHPHLSMSQEIRALVLAAGFGTRLAPLTERRPKPLIPVRGKPILALTLECLAGVGCRKAAVNLHHLGDQIPEHFGAAYRGIDLVYSEETEILGTLGALAPVAEMLGDAEVVLLVNGDSLCRWPLKRLLAHHRRHRPAATLLFAERADPARFGGGVAIDATGRVVSFRPGTPPEGTPGIRRLVFAGAHALDPALVERAPARFSSIISELYEPLMAEGADIRAVTTRRPWHDLGTPRRFRDAVTGGGASTLLGRLFNRSWHSPQAVIGQGVRLKRAVVEGGVRVADGAHLEMSVVLPGSRIGEGADVRGSVVAFDTTIPAGFRVEDKLVASRSAIESPPAGSSVVGDLVYAPIDPVRSSS